MSYSKIPKEHSEHKYNTLRKILGVCRTYDNKWHNFNCFVDLHGGYGESSLMASKLNIPIIVCEIDPKKMDMIKAKLKGYNKVQYLLGDCNVLIDDILQGLDKYKFTFFFADPDGFVVYPEGKKLPENIKGKHYQLTHETVQKIGRGRNDLLINFPWEAITRCTGFAKKQYKGSPTHVANIDKFFGTHSWYEFEPGDWESLLNLYVITNIKPYYPSYECMAPPHMLVKTNKNVLVYHLIYATKNPTANKIMKDIMGKEQKPMSSRQFQLRLL